MTETVEHFDFSIDLQRAILWQYDNAPALKTLVESKQAWYDQWIVGAFDVFEPEIFNLQTCDENGLQIWAIILNLPLFITTNPSPVGYPAWGFGAFGKNFFDGNFGSNGSGQAGLTVDESRILLRLRYYQLTSDCCVTSINKMLDDIFGGGGAYVIDNYDMTATYFFDTYNPTATLLYALQVFDVLPRPAGVELNILLADTYAFGFADFGRNFFDGNFARVE
jgi:hypothetical protein